MIVGKGARQDHFNHFLWLKTISCQQLQHFLNGDIYKYVYSFYTMGMYLWYCLTLLLLSAVFMFCHYFFKELCKYIMFNCRLMLVLTCWYMSRSRFDVIIMMYVIYLLTVLFYLNFWISVEYLQDSLHCSIICKLISVLMFLCSWSG